MTPQKTIERLILYSTILEKLLTSGTTCVFSKQLAELTGNTAAQVRRDLMFVGYTGNPQSGYTVSSLLESIRGLLEPERGISIVLVGVGNLGRALLSFFVTMQSKFTIIASFDNDSHKTDRVIGGFHCYHVDQMRQILTNTYVQLGIITVPASQAQAVADRIVDAGVKGIVNFAPVPIKVPADVYVENMHITMTIEKAAYFSRSKSVGERFDG
ncbi:MAG: redox-sensing transcriptional repressor Rex [Chitinivibrionales bacterium]|nr:redox-sensing transcriptional repressor Rex [Chitinivibrionales bacterium]